MRASTPDPGMLGMLVLATGTLRHWARSLGWKRSRTLSLSRESVTSCIWEPAWFQQVKGLKASKKAKRLEYGLMGERWLSMEVPWVSPLNYKENRKRREKDVHPSGLQNHLRDTLSSLRYMPRSWGHGQQSACLMHKLLRLIPSTE